MLGADSLLAFLLAAGALVLAPGPDTFYVLGRGAGGRRAGIAAAGGVSTGILVHTGAVVLGLAALLRTAPAAYDLLRYVGACYLLVLGVATLRDASAQDGGAGTPHGSGATEGTAGGPSGEGRTPGDTVRGSYARGLAVNVLNPKVAVFFLAFLPQFAGTDATPAELFLLGGCYAVLTMTYLGGVSLAADRAGDLLTGDSRVAGGLGVVSGLVLVGFGAELALSALLG